MPQRSPKGQRPPIDIFSIGLVLNEPDPLSGQYLLSRRGRKMFINSLLQIIQRGPSRPEDRCGWWNTIVTAGARVLPPWQLRQPSPAVQFLSKCRQRFSEDANLQLALIIPRFLAKQSWSVEVIEWSPVARLLLGIELAVFGLLARCLVSSWLFSTGESKD